MSEFYLWIDDKEAGPFSEVQVVEMKRDGKIHGKTPWRGPGDTKWKIVGDWPALFVGERSERIDIRTPVDSNAHKTLKIECPGCSQHIDGPVELIGQQINCPTCSRKFTVPDIRGNLGQSGPPRKLVDPLVEKAGIIDGICLGFWGVGILFVALGLASQDAQMGVAIGGGLIGAGFMLKFLAQFFHIRAALGKMTGKDELRTSNAQLPTSNRI